MLSVHIGHIHAIEQSQHSCIVQCLFGKCSISCRFPGSASDWWRKAAFYLFSDEQSGETKQRLYPITENRCENA